MTNLLEMLKEKGTYSINRVPMFMNDVIFFAITIYLAITNQTWGHYEFYTMFTATWNGLGLGNKFINSKYNTPIGEVGKPMGK